MLKVVGASWLQTRISTYILVAVVIIGIGAIVLSQFKVDNDGIYSATIRWNHRGGFQFDFWGQGNDLETLPMGVARAYYKPRTFETGWATLEIETSSDYPDSVQAHAAGFLEGSLTWQIIHHHWYNTIGTACSENELACEVIRQKLSASVLRAKIQARELEGQDPFWHMIKLFYEQLKGLEAGWRCGVFRSRKSVDISTEDFIWMAMASDLPSFLRGNNAGSIFIKNITDNLSEPLLAIMHNTVAPYSKMLRLLKKYTFRYHMTEAKNAELVPTRTIVSSSYPGALSSQDEYYVLHGENKDDLMVLAGTPLLTETKESSRRGGDSDDAEGSISYESLIVLAAPKIMAANWLAYDAHSWSRSLARRVGPGDTSKALQWVIVRGNDSSVWLVEQRTAATHVVEYTPIFRQKGKLFLDGNTLISIKERPADDNHLNVEDIQTTTTTTTEATTTTTTTTTPNYSMDSKLNNDHEPLISAQRQNNLTDLPNFTSKLLTEESDLKKVINYRGDLEDTPNAIGVIDTKVSLINKYGLKTFEATCGPIWSNVKPAFDWSISFPSKSHMGHPEKFNFKSIVPLWIWF